MDKRFLYIIGGVIGALIIIFIIITVAMKPKTPVVTTPTVLTLWTSTDDNYDYSAIIKDFESKNFAKVEVVKKKTADFLLDSLNEISSNNGPDLWVIPASWMPKYHTKFAPLDTKIFIDHDSGKTGLEVYKNIFPNLAQNNIFASQIYALPYQYDLLKIAYRSGAPQLALDNYRQNHTYQETEKYNEVVSRGPLTWDDVVNITRLVTQKNGDSFSQSGIALGTSGNISDSADILTALMLQYGTKMNTDDFSAAQFHTKQTVFGNIDFPARQALSFFSSFADAKNANYTWNNNMPDATKAFLDDKLSMLICYSSQLDKIQKENPDYYFATMSLPQIKGSTNPVYFASYNNIGITRVSKHATLAQSFIGLLSEYEQANLNWQSSSDNELKNAENWYNPEPQKTKDIFNDMIKQVNNGAAAQTALDGAAAQVTTLFEAIK